MNTLPQTYLEILNLIFYTLQESLNMSVCVYMIILMDMILSNLDVIDIKACENR